MPERLGGLEELTLLAVAACGDATSGAARGRLDEAGRVVTPGALYSTLRRLEAKGWVISWLGEARARVRPRRHYRLTPEGRATVEAARATREHLWQAARDSFLD